MTKATSRLLSCSLLAALCLLAISVWAQTAFDHIPASQRKLISINVTGSKRYSSEAIATATGLQIGTTLVEDDLKKAARRLGDMGVFSDIGYTFSYSSDGTKLSFQVSDAEKFSPVRFEDFVWFTDLELLSRIKASVPLFNGSVPLSGSLAEQISDVLQTMLVENGIPGHVEYTRTATGPGQPDAIVYHVADVVIRVRNIEFTGTGDAELSPLEEAAKRLPEREYSRTRLEAFAQHDLLPVYHARGYLKAAFSEPQPKVVKQPGIENEDGPKNQTLVDVTFAATPGPQYKLNGLEWSGNHEFPSDVLQKMVIAPSGQPANTVRISDNLKDIQKLYGSKGYVTATLKASAIYDDATSTVVIRIDVNEGPVYHMGDLEFRGLDNSLTAKLRNVWKIRPGDVYDSTYLSDYLPEARKLLPSTFDWDVSSHVTANVREKTVDVDLIYSVKAPK